LADEEESMRFGAWKSLVFTAGALVLAGVPASAQEAPPPTSAEPPVEDIAAQIASARKKSAALVAKNDFAGALKVLHAAGERLGPQALLATEEGVVLLAHGRFESANGGDEKLFESLYSDAAARGKKALELDADCGPAAVLLSGVLVARHDSAAARKSLSEWLAKRPKDAVVRLASADLLFGARKWAEAEAEYAKFLEENPTHGPARLNHAIARKWLQAPPAELEKVFLDAARLLPESDLPVQYLVGLHAKDRNKKVEVLRKAIAQNSRAVAARVWLASVLRRETPEDLKGALGLLREAARLAPDNAGIHRDFAEVIEETKGSIEDAVEAYVVAVDKSGPGLAGRESDAIDRLLHLTEGGDKVGKKVRERAYDVLCEKNPEEGRYGNNAGFWFREAGDYEKSVRYYLFSVKAAPDNQDWLNDTALIYLYHLSDRKDRCLPLLDKVVELVRKQGKEPKRGYWDALENLCKYWFEKGEWQKVVEYGDLRADPDASMNGRPYPSMKAADYRARAIKEMEKK
jgi:tetratricopeptide (TPR) repeat protein